MDHSNKEKGGAPIKPAAIKAIGRSKELLKTSLSDHNRAMLILAPSLQNVGDSPQSRKKTSLWSVQILLPSSFSKTQRENLGLAALAKMEAGLRVGHGHDVLEKLRKALGVKSFLAKRANDRTNYRYHTRSEGEVRRAQSIVNQWASIYRKNWDGLTSLDVRGPVLKGLQELKKEDQVLLGAWLEDEQYARPSTALPWIWKVSPLLASEKDLSDGKVAELVSSWNEEGGPVSWRFILFFGRFADLCLFVRPQF